MTPAFGGQYSILVGLRPTLARASYELRKTHTNQRFQNVNVRHSLREAKTKSIGICLPLGLPSVESVTADSKKSGWGRPPVVFDCRRKQASLGIPIFSTISSVSLNTEGSMTKRSSGFVAAIAI